ncbi:hypothetical protein FNV43_RR07745 [Rhamnella rubrinervis]|uniref:Cysteine-rich receptor-like protein kinase 10 n=1 Tax=Rhamnella rubrinervis TaxID=2594499 RepID=A0A8K0HH47_9ROSA|nr:hypothetical protein FNV43_RR07745 [Rhamnella rubrinervis]
MKIPAVIIWMMLSLLSLTNEAVPEYRAHICTNTTILNPNSTYKSNLNHLLSSLTSNASRALINNNGFYNTTTGQDSSTVVYGSFLCRGDVTTADVCRECVATAAKGIQQNCPLEKEAVIWYDLCMLRYSDVSFFGNLNERNVFFTTNQQNVTEPDRFRQLLADTMSLLVDAVADAPTGTKMFAAKKAKFTGFQTLYSLVECTPDLSTSNCNRCLQNVVAGFPSCCVTKTGARKTSSVVIIVAIGASTVVVLMLLLSVGYYLLRRRARDEYMNSIHLENVWNDSTISEPLQFDFRTIQAATSNFSDNNKLGEGGFGEVYKGVLSNGREIAVKRLSRNSGQGIEEFKNEVLFLAKLHHRNLTRLLGSCFKREEKILIYEFVPNKSLDHFLIDPKKGAELDWSRRYKIINGVARGLLYLHEDSRFKIIHRDLKSSNILLDEDMNPKISDFGVAKIFKVDQTQGNTKRIAGTYGYMAPEYAYYGRFSVKSDVFSFGILILEIIIGKKSCHFYQSDGAEDLLSCAWRQWRNGTVLKLLDPNLGDSYSREEVIRCVHVALLCVEEDPADRPTMASVIVMLNSNTVTMALPQKPAFFPHSTTSGPDAQSLGLESDEQSPTKSPATTVHEMSISEIYP